MAAATARGWSHHPNIWADCRFIRECSILQILAAQLPLLSLDTAWVDWADTPRNNPHKGNRMHSIETEIRLQNRRNQAVALGPEVIAQLEAACSGPVENWVGNLRVLNISAGDAIPMAEHLSVPHKDNARQTLQAFLVAGLGGRDDTSVQSVWQDARPKVHVRVNTDLSIADPFNDAIREVLPS